MIDLAAPIFCAGINGIPCGRYVTLASMADKAPGEQWREAEDGGYVCPDCFRSRLKAATRAAMRNGVRLDTKGMSASQRQAAGEVLGEDLLAAVDRGWGRGS